MPFRIPQKDKLPVSKPTQENIIDYISEQGIHISDKRVTHLRQCVYNTRVNALNFKLKTMAVKANSLPMTLDIGFLTENDKTALLAELTAKGYNVTNNNAVDLFVATDAPDAPKTLLLCQDPHDITIN